MPHSTDYTSLPAAAAPAKAKILMLHGHAESGPCFQAKTRRIEKYLQNAYPAFPSPNSHPEFPGGVELFYPTAPLRLTPADVTRGCGPVDLSNQRGEVGLSSTRENQETDAWAWGTGDFRKAEEINGLSQSVRGMLKYMQENGPFVGVVGFSCGATLAAILASMLEGNRFIDGFEFPENFSHPPLRFAVCYSGFILHFPGYRQCYYPKIRTPIMTVIGRYDPMTEESQTILLTKRCQNATLLYHPGAHYVPTKTYFLLKVGEFIDSALGNVPADEDADWVDI